MHVGGGGNILISMFYRGGMTVLCALVLAGCSERELSVAFLKTVSGDSDFKIVNAKNENDVDVKEDLTTVPLEVACSESVNAIEVYDSATSAWANVASVDTQADVDCSDKVASFSLPLSFLEFPLNPTDSGVVKKDFKLRWSYQSLTGETQTQSRTYTAVSTPPDGQIVASDITATNQNSYSVSGTCSGTGTVEVSGPFVAPLAVICNNGTWTANPQVDTNYPYLSGVVAKFYLGSGTARGPFTEKVASVRVDVLPPTLSISEPTADQIYTGMDTVHFKGECSESLRTVTILQGTTELGTTNCTAANTFDVDLPALVDGNYLSVKVAQFDEVGNRGESTGVNFKKDTTGPGAFNITGVVSQSGVDSATDWMLTAPGLKFYITTTPDAAKYKASVIDATGLTICPWQEITTTNYFDFSGCALSDTTTYKIQAVGYDEYDNATMASNNGQNFSINYDRPQVIAVTSPNTGAFKAGQAIDILVKFNKNINVSSLPAPRLKMNVGSYATFTNVSGNDTMVFQYVVQDGENTLRLEYMNASSLEDGNITMPITNLEALRTLPSLGTSQLAEKNIVIDTIEPAPPTSLTITEPIIDTSKTPSLSWVSSATPTDVDSYRLEFLNGNTLALLNASILPSSATGITTQDLPANTALNGSTPVLVRLYSIDKAGNENYAETSYTTPVCPINYIYVPTRGSVTEFCVAKYEMKFGAGDGFQAGPNTSVIPISSPMGTPWTGVSLADARGRCQSLPGPTFTYDLITAEQWQSLGLHLSEQSANWIGSISASGGRLKAGLTSDVASTPQSAMLRCYPSADCSGSSVNDRVMTTSTGATIWDLAGNAAEWVFSSTNIVSMAADSIDYISTAMPVNFSPVSNCVSSLAAPYCGYGKYWTSSTVGFALRGGSYSDDSSGAGIFATEGVTNLTRRSDVGFRCVYKIPTSP